MHDDGDPDDPALSSPPATLDSIDEMFAAAVARPAVLAPGAVIADRYEIEATIGAGGMGTVYRARDRALQRTVAVKVHRAATDPDRLHREAVAMAQLAHPNVVTVFEVGEVAGRPFVAMEYVEGPTLRAYLSDRKRSRAEILDLLLAAGAGIAAAHAAGFVHRDIKPDNILVGADGRARIGDFGLAALLADASDAAHAAGTPQYMAPEQIDGRTVDARSDQFAFCVTAWEALHGERPFGGETMLELRAAIERAVPRPGRRPVPAWLRRVLARGLAANPDRRWPSLPALLRALRAGRTRRRVLAGAAAVLAIAAPLTAWAVWPAPDPELACATRASALEVALPPSTTTALVAAVRASGGPNAGDRADLLATAFATQYGRAAEVSDRICRSEATRRWSAEMAAAGRDCAAEHAAIVREILTGIPPTRGSSADLLFLAARVPAVEPCADPHVLAGRRPLGPDAIEARAKVERATALVQLGRIADADAIARTALGGRAELLRAKLEVARGAYADAEHRLSEAYFASRAGEDPLLSLRLVSDLIDVTATLRRDPAAADRWIREGIADAEREHERYPIDAADVLDSAAAAATFQGDAAHALELCDRSDAFAAAAHGITQKSDGLRTSAYADLGRLDEAIAASDRHLAALRKSLGADHPLVAAALGDRASILLDAGRQREAEAAATEAAKIIDDSEFAAVPSVTALEITIGAALLAMQESEGTKFLERARASRVAEFGPDHPDIALIDTNLALVYLQAGETDRALATLRHATEIQERHLGPDHLELAVALYNLAVTEREAKAYDAAAATARRALAVFAKRQPGAMRHLVSLALVAQIENLAGHPERALEAAELGLAFPPGVNDGGAAWAQLEAANALIALDRQPRRVHELLVGSRAAYVRAELPDRVAQVDALLAAHP